MKAKKTTITIGIPAHNEEANIKNMLQSVLRQKQKTLVIEKIIVNCDGCTDDTETIVSRMMEKDKKIILINDKKRLGKAIRLNQILRMNKSDFLVFLDADIILGGNDDLEEMVNTIRKDKRLQVVAANQIPTTSINFINSISNASFMLLKEMADIHNGNHIHNLQGSASILRKEFAASFSFPKGIIIDGGFLYIKAILHNSNAFGIAKNAQVLFRGVTTFQDYRILAARAISEDKQHLITHFGEKIMELYKVPKSHLVKAILKRSMRDPIFTPLSILLDIWVRLFPYKKKVSKNGIWTMLTSTKKAITYEK